MARQIIIFLSFFIGIQSSFSQEITLRQLWASGNFWPDYLYSFNWSENGKSFTKLEQDRITGQASIMRQAIGEDEATAILSSSDLLYEGKPMGPFDDYSLTPDGKKVLLAFNEEQIYRYSSKALYYIFSFEDSSLVPVQKGKKIMFATFSPDYSKVAYVLDNNLYYDDLQTGESIQITKNGEKNIIKNGWSDWVYEEEFAFDKAFFWSNDSKKLAFYTFDEQEVPMYPMQLWGDQTYPEIYNFKYPKAGEKNSEVYVSVFDIPTQQTQVVFDERGKDTYIPRVKWTGKSNVLRVEKLNRLQNEFSVFHINTDSKKEKLVYEEKSDTYIEVDDYTYYLEDSEVFYFTSRKSGYNHIYKYEAPQSIDQITGGEWEVDEFYGVDNSDDYLYFNSTDGDPKERKVFKVKTNGKKKEALTTEKGVSTADFSPDFSRFVHYRSTMKTPYVIKIKDNEGKDEQELITNSRLKQNLDAQNLGTFSFFKFKTSEDIKLNAWMITPPGFTPGKKYPVLLYVYGGPGYQTVKNEWAGPNYIWFQMLAQQGYIVVSVDGRGTGGRGKEFQDVTYGELGKYETADCIETAKYLQGLDYVDSNRIGIWGWSFGGYLTSLCLTKGAQYFKTGIAVAPVTNWRFYDTIYSERYMKTPQLNASGYDDNSPVNHAAKLGGNYLIIHGTGDDNVHFQNAMAMQDALINSNKQFDSFYYPDRNHGIYGGYTRLHLYTLMTNYLKKNL